MNELSPTHQLIAALKDYAQRNDDGRLVVFSEGLFYASVCASLDDEQADARMASRPTGTAHGWQRSTDTHFASGHTNPCPCEQHAHRRHILYEA